MVWKQLCVMVAVSEEESNSLVLLPGEAPGGAEHTRCNNMDDNCVSGEIIAILFSRWLLKERIGAPSCGGALEMFMCCAMCEPMETAQSRGDDTHTAVKRPKWASEHQRHTACGPLCWWVTSLVHQ